MARKRRQTPAQRRASIKNLKKARAALRRRRPYRNWSSVGPYRARRGKKRRSVKGHRRRTNPARGPRRYYYDPDLRPGSWVGMSAVYPTWAKADDQLNRMLESLPTLKQYVDIGTMKVIEVGAPGRGTGYMVVAKAKRRRTSNFASGMRYIHNLPPRARTTRWMANPTSPRLRRAGPRKGRPAWTRRGVGSLSRAQRSLLNWMNRNGGISDGKVTTQTAAVRRALGALHRRGLVRKSGRTGKNARYTLTTKGFHALGNVKGVRVKRVSRRKKR